MAAPPPLYVATAAPQQEEQPARPRHIYRRYRIARLIIGMQALVSMSLMATAVPQLYYVSSLLEYHFDPYTLDYDIKVTNFLEGDYAEEGQYGAVYPPDSAITAYPLTPPRGAGVTDFWLSLVAGLVGSQCGICVLLLMGMKGDFGKRVSRFLGALDPNQEDEDATARERQKVARRTHGYYPVHFTSLPIVQQEAHEMQPPAYSELADVTVDSIVASTTPMDRTATTQSGTMALKTPGRHRRRLVKIMLPLLTLSAFITALAALIASVSASLNAKDFQLDSILTQGSDPAGWHAVSRAKYTCALNDMLSEVEASGRGIASGPLGGYDDNETSYYYVHWPPWFVPDGLLGVRKGCTEAGLLMLLNPVVFSVATILLIVLGCGCGCWPGTLRWC